MKIRYRITVESKDRPRGPVSSSSWYVIDETMARRAVARCKTYKETVRAYYERVELGPDAIVY